MKDERVVTVPFHNYTTDEIITIMKSRINDDDREKLAKYGLVDQKLELVVRRGFTAYSGDARRLLQLVHQFISMTAAHLKDSPHSEVDSVWMEVFKEMTQRMATNNVVAFAKQLGDLPNHAQIVLYAIVREYGKTKKGMTMDRACDCYHRLCTRLKAPSVEDQEVYRIIGNLQTQGLVSMYRGAADAGGVHMKLSTNQPQNRSFRTPTRSKMNRLKGSRCLASPLRPTSAANTIVYLIPSISSSELQWLAANHEGLTGRIVSMVIDEV
eukprot:GHVH01004012.1.p1 GENE.GHVH01004012.1~~GHVH01004012.1.p1  ORF type:complete len:268 (+),score=29.76 GHVH01004012.1:919-1722(+)